MNRGMPAERYSRQTLLPEIGSEGQAAIRSASVLIVGMGGLGSPAALYLTGAGVGRIGLMDSERVELSNLQRQILYQASDLGRLKVEAAREHLTELNPEVEFEALPESLTPDNAKQILSQYDVIVDGTDHLPTKRLINETARALGKSWVYGSASAWEGRVSAFTPEGSCYECLHPRGKKARILSCAEEGVLGPVVGMIGAMQASEALKAIVLKAKAPSVETLAGKLWVLDCKSMQSSIFELPKNPECPVCSKGASAEDPVPEISLEKILARGIRNFSFIDIRSRDEWDEGHLQGAISLPLAELEARPAQAKNGLPTVVYCRRGLQSHYAIWLLRKQGWGGELLSLAGGCVSARTHGEAWEC